VRDEGPFRPWGWPAINAAVLVASGAALLTWVSTAVVVFVAPGWMIVFIWNVLTVSVKLSIRDGDLRWRTLLRSDEVPVRLVTGIRPNRWGYAVYRLIDTAEGQTIRVCEGPEFDRLVRALRREVPDIDIQIEPRRSAS
jgi:hypothetical protein